MTEDDRRVAFHEAGHAVAARFLGVGVRDVSIVEDEDSHGRTRNYRPRGDWEERLESAEHESACGGFIQGRTRRWVETRIMVTLAGGLAEIRATGADDADVGMGIYRLSHAESEALAQKHGGKATDHRKLIHGGDLKWAMDLAMTVSGGDEEGAAYLEWLWQRTLNLLNSPGLWPAVEALAEVLMERKALSGRESSRVIDEARRRAFADRLQHGSDSGRRRGTAFANVQVK